MGEGEELCCRPLDRLEKGIKRHTLQQSMACDILEKK